jgi:hypothetical protein
MSIHTAIRALKREESTLRSRLGKLQSQIRDLEGMARAGTPGRKRPSKRRLSPKGRAAISRAAKKRWAEYRSKKRRKS